MKHDAWAISGLVHALFRADARFREIMIDRAHQDWGTGEVRAAYEELEEAWIDFCGAVRSESGVNFIPLGEER